MKSESVSDLSTSSEFIQSSVNAMMRRTKSCHSLKPKKNQVLICISGQKYKIVTEIARELQWKLTNEHNLWNIFWTDSIMGVGFCLTMQRFQKINHFPGMMEICRKDLLARNLNKMLKVFPEEYNIFPKTWSLPSNYADALNYSLKHKNRTYIIKPAAAAQGRGIYLTQNLKDINMDGMICQVYLKKPLLIDGFKFDLRVYALVTSLDPLRIYIYNEGLTRFATKPYALPTKANTGNAFMHLTNYSLNKHSESFSSDKDKGSKRTFSSLNRILSMNGYDVQTLWNEIDEIVVKTVISALPVLKHNYSASFPRHDVMQACFEILGVDIIIDEHFKPWLLEVNHSPSFSTSEYVDRKVKSGLVRDTFNLLGVNGTDRKNVLRDDQIRVKKRMTKLIRHPKEKQSLRNRRQVQYANELNETRANCDQKQAEWEANHLGGFRRIIPVAGNPEKYRDLIEHQNTTSVYKETISTTQKRQSAAMQRRAISANAVAPRPKPKKIGSDIPKNQFKSVDIGFLPNTIADWEEKERKMMMASRAFLVESCGIRSAIHRDLMLNNCLC
ncbi:tubulin polyglutamylase ttll6-like [Bradysia coprophila]|uniref:tubulin polyglutamylase ttll6-like n=1 Tax=Bradysia coprophila TaxID=38358 RepID=UPI00187DB126|nr:tubulin polyglutamylase ttll6-like [Bradysia coprophila]